jgi:hypothetical protein
MLRRTLEDLELSRQTESAERDRLAPVDTGVDRRLGQAIRPLTGDPGF